jgi:hypothetical protein
MQNPLKLNAKYMFQKTELIPKDEPHQVYLTKLISVLVVFGHVEKKYFSIHTHHFQGEVINSGQRFDHLVEKKNQSFPPNSLLSLSN